MSLYRVVYDYMGNKIISPLNSLGLTSLFYKSVEGPLGFSTDTKGEEILFELIKNGLWFSIKSKDFLEINRATYDSHKYDLKGIIFLSMDAEEKRKIAEARVKLSAIKKNKLLERYNKPLVSLIPNDIVDIFDGNEYSCQNIANLIIGKNVVIWNWSDVGGHLIYHRFSGCIFDKKLDSVAHNFGEKLIDCPLIEVPHW